MLQNLTTSNEQASSGNSNSTSKEMLQNYICFINMLQSLQPLLSPSLQAPSKTCYNAVSNNINWLQSFKTEQLQMSRLQVTTEIPLQKRCFKLTFAIETCCKVYSLSCLPAFRHLQKTYYNTAANKTILEMFSLICFKTSSEHASKSLQNDCFRHVLQARC